MSFAQWIALALIGAAALATAGHALLYKCGPRAAWGWMGVCLISRANLR